MTAHDAMVRAKADIDKIFGEGASLKHPELVAAYLNAAGLDFLAWSVLRLADSLPHPDAG
jgi:hypothetical protein